MTQSYLVVYAHTSGHGRKFFATNYPITEKIILHWEVIIDGSLPKGHNSCITNFVKIDGELK